MAFLNSLFLFGALLSLFVAALALRVLRHFWRQGPPPPGAYPIKAGRRLVGFLLLTLGLLLSFLSIRTAPEPVPFLVVVAIVTTDALALSFVLSVGLLYFSPIFKRRLGKVWVKALDFPYLMFGFFGIMRVINGSPFVAKTIDLLDWLALSALTVALAIRLSKATIEVFFDPWLSR